MTPARIALLVLALAVVQLLTARHAGERDALWNGLPWPGKYSGPNETETP